MKVTVFSKKIVKKDGTRFTGYVTKLHNNTTGDDDYCRVRFNEGCHVPAEFPVIIEIPSGAANLAIKHKTNEDGSVWTGRTLWISEYKSTNEHYVDHSLDAYN